MVIMAGKTKMTHDMKELKLLSFLQYLYGELCLDAKQVSLNNLCKEWEVPNPLVVSMYIVDLGFVIKSGASMKTKYKWNPDMKPTIDNVNKLIVAVNEYSNKAAKKYNDKVKGVKSTEIEVRKEKGEVVSIAENTQFIPKPFQEQIIDEKVIEDIQEEKPIEEKIEEEIISTQKTILFRGEEYTNVYEIIKNREERWVGLVELNINNLEHHSVRLNCFVYHAIGKDNIILSEEKLLFSKHQLTQKEIDCYISESNMNKSNKDFDEMQQQFTDEELKGKDFPKKDIEIPSSFHFVYKYDYNHIFNEVKLLQLDIEKLILLTKDKYLYQINKDESVPMNGCDLVFSKHELTPSEIKYFCKEKLKKLIDIDFFTMPIEAEKFDKHHRGDRGESHEINDVEKNIFEEEIQQEIGLDKFVKYCESNNLKFSIKLENCFQY